MSILQAITDFFESIFNRNSPEVQKKLQLKKLETELKSYTPQIFLNGNLQPNFAEAIRLLYINTKPLNNLFSATIGSPDAQKAHRFEAQLVITGYKNEEQKELERLSYAGRIEELNTSSMTTSQIFDRQRRSLDKLLHALAAENFRKIDKNLITLHQLSDFCRFNFVTIIQVFDPNFIAADGNYQPTYQEIFADRLSSALEDLFYQVNGLTFSNSILNAIAALEQLRSSGNSTKADTEALFKNVKAIAYILNNVLTTEKLRQLIRYTKQDMAYEPKFVTYKESACHNFEQMMQSRFKADELRIKTEMKDENIKTELSQLFGSTPMLELSGYNENFNNKLIQNGQSSFLWILPMQILKTFLTLYLTEPIRSLLNDIVIEGFFNNPAYKTEFSNDVYAALETSQAISDFEGLFVNGAKYSSAILEGYIRDGKNDPDFLKKLEQAINEINSEANKIVTKETNSLNRLYKHLGDLITDAKKPTSEIISNLKVLMMSSRNRDNTNQLEQQYPNWENFFKIMKNYAIINGQ